MEAKRCALDAIATRPKESSIQADSEGSRVINHVIDGRKKELANLHAFRKYRQLGIGPAYVKISARCVRYRRSDVLPGSMRVGFNPPSMRSVNDSACGVRRVWSR